MEENLIQQNANKIRDVIRYLKKFKNALVIIYMDETILDSSVFISHIKDICMLHDCGLKVIIVPGANKRINEVLKNAGINWTIHNNSRITNEDAMPLIKMAAFDVSNQIMTSLAGEKKTALIGNWVRSRGKGVVSGFDYGTSGEIERLEIESIRTVLDNGFIPIFPCIGWSLAGKPYNISSIELAQQIAIQLKADKLFYLVPDAEITKENFNIPSSVQLSEDGKIPAMNLKDLDEFIYLNTNTEHKFLANSTSELSVNSLNSTNEHLDLNENVPHGTLNDKILYLLDTAKAACKNNVNRVHILNGKIEGIIPCEIFSDLGSGTMIYSSNYGKIRPMEKDDITSVLNVMQPFIEQGILLPRTKESLSSTYNNYYVYELDGAIRACASLIPYDDGQVEIAGVAVDKNFSNMGIGPKLIMFLVEQSKEIKARNVFLLTTQTADWFEKLGFVSSSVDSLPEERKKLWNPSRGSKVLKFNN